MAQIIEMPKLSDTMVVGTVSKWLKNKGDAVSNGDILAEIETDKATMELENFDEGVLLDVFVPEGSEAPIGCPLAVIGEEGEDVSSLRPPENFLEIQAEAEEPPSSPAPADKPDGGSVNQSDEVVEGKSLSTPSEDSPPKETKPDGEDSRILASPLARKMALEKKIDLATISGTGPRGRITKKDLEGLDHSSPPKAIAPRHDDSSVASGGLEDKTVPLSKMRSVIAARLLESKNSIPHFYLQKEINAQPLRLAREAINHKLHGRNGGSSFPKVTINDLILKACADTISWHPEINTSWEEKSIRFHGTVNLSFGVAVEDGLLTPVIRNAEALSLLDLSSQAKSLIDRARSKKLAPDEMSGSTFTVTNLGMYGIDFFSGIINPPNAAILSVGASSRKAVVGLCGNVVVGETMVLGLSCDHRLIDGAMAAQFLKSLGENLENPASMLI